MRPGARADRPAWNWRLLGIWLIDSIFLPRHGSSGSAKYLTPAEDGQPGGEFVFHEAVDVGSLVDSLVGTYGATIMGAALILGGIFLRLLGKGIAYLLLGLGIAGTVYVALVRQEFLGLGPSTDMGLVYAVFLGGIATSVALALAVHRLTVAFAFGFFTTGWYLVLQAVLPSIESIPGASTWVGSSIGTTVLAELFMRRLMRSRRLPVPAVAPIASMVRGVRR